LLFRPYWRGLASHPRTGLGLGLYIVSEIARAHGGAIQVSSSREEGTVFTCVLKTDTSGPSLADSPGVQGVSGR
jgi:signal transduction histidine kinase